MTSPDKFAHFLATVWAAGEGTEIIGNKYWGSLAGTGFVALKEIPDGLLPWEEFGLIGGDGASYRDIIADGAGGFYNLHLHDDIVQWLGVKSDRPEPPKPKGFYKRPLSDEFPGFYL